MKKIPQWVQVLFYVVIGAATVGALGLSALYISFTKDLPEIISLKDYRPAIVTEIVATDGKESKLIGEFYKERRYVVAYDQIPEKLIQAFIAAEDDQFFNHQGVNFASIIRASIANFRAGHVVQGGSTITQQVAKSLLLSPEKSMVRKVRELILASQMERNLGKQEILALYLNQIYLGHGAYGVKAAAQVYFGKELKDLTIAECALMAGMPQAPGKFSPHLNPKKAKERQVYVLRRMNENRFISQGELEKATVEELRVHDNTDVNSEYSPYLVETIRKYLQEKYGEEGVYEQGLQVLVNTSPSLLKSAGKLLREGLREIDQRTGFRGPVAHLKTPDDIQKRIEKNRLELVMKELGYDVLTAKGTLEPLNAVKLAGLQSEGDLLKIGTLYSGVVTSYDEKKKSTGVMIGLTKVVISPEGAKWASRGRPLNAFLRNGDVIWVKIIKKDGDTISASLEQVPEIQGAVFSMDTRTGQVLAMEGGYDFQKSEFNRAIQAQRQIGSSFKPILFSAALENGFTPASVIVDAPIVYDDKEAGKWKPTNFEEKFYGDTTFRQALIKSRNIPTIKIVQSVGVGRMIEFAKRLGMTTHLSPDLSISLGSATIPLAELTKLYAVYPRAGRKITPLYFSIVRDRNGKVLEEQKPKVAPPVDQVIAMAENQAPLAPAKDGEGSAPVGEEESKPENETKNNGANGRGKLLPSYPLEKDPDQVLDPRVAYVATHLMKEVVSFGTGVEAKQLGRPAAGKTGTTNEYLDAWFMGFTPQVVTGVWVGYDTLKSIGSGETGARAALPIWLNFMKEAVKNLPPEDFEVPPGIKFVSIHPQSGKPVPPNASYAIKEAFIEGTEPSAESAVSERVTPRSTSDFLKEDID
jgi:penicillin-binding protein 1A